MTDPNVDHSIVGDNQGFLSLESLFLDFQFNLEETVKECVNRIVFLVAKDVKLHLGIHDLQD